MILLPIIPFVYAHVQSSSKNTFVRPPSCLLSSTSDSTPNLRGRFPLPPTLHSKVVTTRTSSSPPPNHFTLWLELTHSTPPSGIQREHSRSGLSPNTNLWMQKRDKIRSWGIHGNRVKGAAEAPQGPSSLYCMAWDGVQGLCIPGTWCTTEGNPTVDNTSCLSCSQIAFSTSSRSRCRPN